MPRHGPATRGNGPIVAAILPRIREEIASREHSPRGTEITTMVMVMAMVMEMVMEMVVVIVGDGGREVMVE